MRPEHSERIPVPLVKADTFHNHQKDHLPPKFGTNLQASKVCGIDMFDGPDVIAEQKEPTRDSVRAVIRTKSHCHICMYIQVCNATNMIVISKRLGAPCKDRQAEQGGDNNTP